MVSLVRCVALLAAARVFSGLTRPISYAAAMGFTFAYTEALVANQRAKDDALNGVAGGCAAGFLAGIKGEPSR